MERQLTINLSDDVYEVLLRQVDGEHVSQFIDDLLRPIVVSDDDKLVALYRDMACDTSREDEALEWIEASPDDALE